MALEKPADTIPVVTADNSAEALRLAQEYEKLVELQNHHDEVVEHCARITSATRTEQDIANDVKASYQLMVKTIALANKYEAVEKEEKIFDEILRLYDAHVPGFYPYKKYNAPTNCLYLSRGLTSLDKGSITLLDNESIEREMMVKMKIANKLPASPTMAQKEARSTAISELKLIATSAWRYASNLHSFQLNAAGSAADTICIIGNSEVYPAIPLFSSTDNPAVAKFINEYFDAQAPIPVAERKKVKIVIPYANVDGKSEFPLHIYKKIFCASLSKFLQQNLPCSVFILNAENFFPEDDVQESPFKMQECVRCFLAYKVNLVFPTAKNLTLPPFARYLLGCGQLLYYRT